MKDKNINEIEVLNEAEAIGSAPIDKIGLLRGFLQIILFLKIYKVEPHIYEVDQLSNSY